MTRIIAVTADPSAAIEATGTNEHGRLRPTPARVHISEAILEILRRSGAHTIILPPGSHDCEAIVAWVVANCHGLVITGGHFDIHPAEYGQTVTARLDNVDAKRTNLELELARAAIQNDLPVLGICGGMQALAVAGGGSLHQDIKTDLPHALEHEQSSMPSVAWHPISIETGLLRKAYGCSIVRVNSTHHQAVNDPGCFTVTARAPDGVIEAIEHPALRCCVGIQWHPEYIDEAPLNMLSWFALNPG
jgi:putative glutamine amidotransferase